MCFYNSPYCTETQQMFSRQKRVGAAKLRISLGSLLVLRGLGGKDGCVETHPGYLVADLEEVVGKIKKRQSPAAFWIEMRKCFAKISPWWGQSNIYSHFFQGTNDKPKYKPTKVPPWRTNEFSELTYKAGVRDHRTADDPKVAALQSFRLAWWWLPPSSINGAPSLSPSQPIYSNPSRRPRALADKADCKQLVEKTGWIKYEHSDLLWPSF